MRKCAVMAGFFVAVFAFAGALKPIPVDDFLSQSSKFDKKVVCVTGKIASLKSKKSKDGVPYSTFVLKGRKGDVHVYFKGNLDTGKLATHLVKVTGIFEVERKVGKSTFKNEIDATPGAGKPYGVELAQSATSPAKK